jgi:hypothetical protein
LSPGRRGLGEKVGELAVDPELHRGFVAAICGEHVRQLGKDDEAVELVVAVGPTAEDVEGKIDLGPCGLDLAGSLGDGSRQEISRLVPYHPPPSRLRAS